MEYILYCDESVDKGPKYCDFFGGCIVSSKDLNEVVTALEKEKEQLNLIGEIKWTKVTEPYLEKYISVMRLFFQFVREGKVKVRIMFRTAEDAHRSGITYGHDEKYFKLYYQFIKHSFGFDHTQGMEPFSVRIYMDQLPTKSSSCDEFKAFLHKMPETHDFEGCALRIRKDQIAEVHSHEHVLLQCADIVMGAMQFKLNGRNLEKPEGKLRRGKRTIAKEKLYKAILAEIQSIEPGFNIGISTGARGLQNPHWESPYEHWLFQSSLQ